MSVVGGRGRRFVVGFRGADVVLSVGSLRVFRPDGKKKAYVRLTADHDALDVANKVSLPRSRFRSLDVGIDRNVFFWRCRSDSSKRF